MLTTKIFNVILNKERFCPYEVQNINSYLGGGEQRMKKVARFSQAFTLIELLIVIVIIGILAGVLIAVINPAQQQNRAKDANVKAAMNKVALSTEGYISAYGKVPNANMFFGSLQNVTEPNLSCSGAAADVYTCLYTVNGSELGALCDAVAEYYGVAGDAAQCYYRYYGGYAAPDTTHFRIFGKSYGQIGRTFVYDNQAGTAYSCEGAVDETTDLVGTCEKM